MKTEEILAQPARILQQGDRERYFADGFIGVSALVPDHWLGRLNEVTSDFVELSRSVQGKDPRFDLEPDHTADAPRIRRLNSPVDFHDVYWEFASRGPFVDVAVDLLGSNVKFHHSKLNFKWSGGGEEVKWHQDIQFWPHTNYDVLTIGVYLDDVADDMAPMGVVPGSHEGPLFDLYSTDGAWTGNLRDEDLPAVDLASAVYLGGPAGSITVHNCRSIHGSPPNMSPRPRPLLLCAYSAADAIPITNLTAKGLHAEHIVHGEAARWARFDPRPCLLPPDWGRTGFKSIFEHQQGLM
ncbi:MAG: phytanoyl-CoA dioxygenase family protein [Proteobacteria bacterium]|nr:phytanoyl-CoA dioxygenase family protein [Pseudomonadota bacterium]